MEIGKHQRRVILGLVLAFAGAFALFAAWPVWFPWLLESAAARADLRYTRYERRGYAGFALQEVGFTNRSVSLVAGRIEAVSPATWIWRVWRNGRADQAIVGVADWRVVSHPDPGAEPISLGPAGVQAALEKLNRWLPAAAFSNGVVRVGRATLDIPSLTWSNGIVRAEAGLAGDTRRVALRGDFTPRPPYEVDAVSETLGVRSTVTVFTNDNVLNLRGATFWRSNRIDLEARFAPRGTLPAEAALRADTFRFPAEMARLSYYEDITGSLLGRWREGRFEVNLRAGARPPPGQPHLPPFELNLQARGDTNATVIETAKVSSPWLVAELSRQLTVSFDGRRPGEPATLRWTADLGRQPFVPLTGSIIGEADLSPTESRYPAVRFRASGRNVGSGGVVAREVAVEGGFEWPWLRIAKANADFADGSQIRVGGGLELRERRIENGEFRLTGPLVVRWLPPGCTLGDVLLSARFQGPLTNPAHQGSLEITDFVAPRLRPMQARARWEGTGLNARQADLELDAGGMSLAARGSTEVTSISTNLLLTRLSLLANRQPILELDRPCGVSLTPLSKGRWEVVTTAFGWVGGGPELRGQAWVRWPLQGALRASARGLESKWIEAFLAPAPEKTAFGGLVIQQVELAAGWTNGPVAWDLELAAAGGWERTPVSVNLLARGLQNGLSVSNLTFLSGTSTVAAASGFLPVTLTPGEGTNLLRVDSRKPLQFHAAARPGAFFWREVGKRLGVGIVEPGLTLDISGPWGEPRGLVRLQARRLSPESRSDVSPVFDDLLLQVELERHGVRVTEGRVLAQGQPLIFTGELPLGEDAWIGLMEGRWPDLKQAGARLRIPDAEIAALADLYPRLLSPQGTLDVDLSLLPGMRLAGEVQVQGVRTRPLPGLGPVRDLGFRLTFQEGAAVLKDAALNIGGSRVTVGGRTQLGGARWFAGELPPLVFTVLGTNVPLSRQPDSIVRGDLNLAITKTNGAPPLISGEVYLRDSFYLSELGALAPGKVTVPSGRPPYFSVDDPFLGDWRLAVRVAGERFLRVRSPLFDGRVTANAQLEGTLRDPVAVGDARIDSGAVRFPFASLRVQQGFVTLSRQDPYHPQLNITAASRQFGYDVKMSVTGAADAPVLQFTSTPPLSSEEILLMVTAGEMPRRQEILTGARRAQALAVYLGRDALARFGFGDQAEERLTIRSGEEITLEGTPTYRIEYKLGERWYVVGEYDRFNDYNVGLRWRIYSK
jgi:translocation and assembly module TamB